MIKIGVKRAGIVDKMMPALGLTVERVEMVFVEADPNELSVILI